MKCEICEREGFKHETWLCLAHGRKVGDLINELKPKVIVMKLKTSGSYICEDGEYTVTIPPQLASALYDHIKRERGENA